MITEKQANLARENHSEHLRKLGAHSIGVDEIEKDGEKTFAVVAYSKQKIQNLPNELEVNSGNDTLKVPLISKISEPFKLE